MLAYRREQDEDCRARLPSSPAGSPIVTLASDRPTSPASRSAIGSSTYGKLVERHRPVLVRRGPAFLPLARRRETDRNPTDGIRTPPPNQPTTPVLTLDQIRALLATCIGREFLSRRDTAILYVFVDCRLRLAEVGVLTVDAVDIRNRMLFVVDTAPLWLGARNRAPTTASSECCSDGRTPSASRFTRTCSGTLGRRSSRRSAAARVASWCSAVGAAWRCSTATAPRSPPSVIELFGSLA